MIGEPPTWICPVCRTGVAGNREPEEPGVEGSALKVRCEEHFAPGGQVCRGSGEWAVSYRP